MPGTAGKAGGATEENTMKLSVPYGGCFGEVDFHAADVRLLQTEAKTDVDEASTFVSALGSPIESPVLGDFLSGAEDTVVIVNDAKRPTPTARVLAHIGPELATVRELLFIVATGTHRDPTKDELDRILDGAVPSGARVAVHDSKDSSAMRRLGRTPLGTDVGISRLVTDVSRIVVVGSVEPHYFAGFTGGRKAFLPGVAAYDTVRQNHSHAMHPGSKLMALAGNPVHEDMMDALGLLEDARQFELKTPEAVENAGIFAIMTVLDKRHQICGAFAGDLRATFRPAVDMARGLYAAPIDRKADIVIAVAEDPADSDLYQAHKAIESGKLALAEEGILILVAACPEGLGNDSFVCQLSSSSCPEEVAGDIGLEYSLGDHKAVKLAELMTTSEIWAVTQLPEDTVSSIFFRPYRELQKAVDDALRIKGPRASVLVILDAAATVPCLA